MKPSVAGHSARTFLVLLLAIPAMLTHAYAGYKFVTLHAPGATSMAAYGVSSTNVVGYFTDKAGVDHGFVYNGKSYNVLDDPAGDAATYATGISANVVVGYYFDSGDEAHAFKYDGTSFTTLNVPSAGSNTFANGISGNVIVGSYDDSIGNSHGFMFDGTTYTTVDYPGTNTETHLTGISGNNIVGYYFGADSNIHGFTYSSASFATLDHPCGVYTWAYGIDGTNTVGAFQAAAAISKTLHGYVYNGTTFTLLDNPSGIGSTNPYAVSGSTIVGSYATNHGDQAFVATPDGGSAQEGKYTLLLTATDTSANIPQGTAYATIAVAKSGKATLAGKLADGQSFSGSGTIAVEPSDSELAVSSTLKYPSVTTKKTVGSLTGSLILITSTNTGATDIHGTLAWAKPQQSKGAYPAAITTNLTVIGSHYTPPSAGQPDLLGFNDGTLELSDTGALASSGAIQKQITFDKTVTVDNPGADKLKLTVTSSTGVFKGSFKYPASTGTPKTVDLSGVLFEDQLNGGGYFLGPNGSGTVTLTPMVISP